MDNSNSMAFTSAKRLLKVFLLLGVYLASGVGNLSSAGELKLNILPTIGKPVYGVAEFGPSASDPISVIVASESEYRKAGYTRPVFLNSANVRKLATNRYLVTTSTPVDSNNFALLLDAQFTDFRRIYPVEISVSSGQAVANFAPAREYDQPAKVDAPKVSQPAVATPAPATQPMRVVLDAPVERAAPQIQPAAIYAAPTPQPQIIFPQTNSQSSSSSAEQFPFYLVVIVMTVLILVAMFVVVLFMHKNHDPRHATSPHTNHGNQEQNNFASDLLKLLPSLMGHNQSQQSQQPQLPHAPANAPMLLPQPWHDEPRYAPARDNYRDTNRGAYVERDQDAYRDSYTDSNRHSSRHSEQESRRDSTSRYEPLFRQEPQSQNDRGFRQEPGFNQDQDYREEPSFREAPFAPQQAGVSQEPALSQEHKNRRESEVASERTIKQAPAQTISPARVARPARPARPNNRVPERAVHRAPTIEAPAATRPAAPASPQSGRPQPAPAPQQASASPQATVPPQRAGQSEQLTQQHTPAAVQLQAGPAAPVAQAQAEAQAQAPRSAATVAKGPIVAQDKSEKLQLAIVYMNMGDEVMARMLLEEIGREGSDAEKNEAKAILAKMNNASELSIIADKNDDAK